MLGLMVVPAGTILLCNRHIKCASQNNKVNTQCWPRLPSCRINIQVFSYTNSFFKNGLIAKGIIVNKLSVFVICCITTVSLSANGADEGKCQKPMEYIGHIYYAKNISRNDDAGEVFKKQTNDLLTLLKSEEISRFKMLTEDMSIEFDSYGGGSNVILSTSFSINFDGDYKAITLLQKSSGARSISVSKNSCVSCNC